MIAENVQTTIELMKQKDPSKVSKVRAALEKDILEVYRGLRNETHKQMLVDRFNDLGGGKVIVDYMAFLKDTGVEHDDVLQCLFQCYNVLTSMTNSSVNFASSLGGTDLFVMLVREADKLMSRYKSNKVTCKIGVNYSLCNTNTNIVYIIVVYIILTYHSAVTGHQTLNRLKLVSYLI